RHPARAGQIARAVDGGVEGRRYREDADEHPAGRATDDAHAVADRPDGAIGAAVRAEGARAALLAALGPVVGLGACGADAHAVLPALLELVAGHGIGVEAARATRQGHVAAEPGEDAGLGAGRAGRVLCG